MTKTDYLFSHHSQYIAYSLLIMNILLLEVFIGLGIILMPPWISISGIILIILFCFFCVRLQWGVYLLILIVPLRIGRIQIHNNFASEAMLRLYTNIDFFFVFFVIILLAWFLRACSKLENRINIPPVNSGISVLFLLLASWNAVSLFWAPNFFIGFMQYARLVMNISIFYLFYVSINNVDLLRRVAWTWLILGLTLFVISFITVYGISLPEKIAKISHNGVIWDETYELFDNVDLSLFWKIQRDRGTAFCSPHKLSLLQNCIIAIGFGLLMAAKKANDKKWFLIAGILILLLSSHSTSLSKGGTISLLGMAFFFFVISHQLRRKFIRNVFIFFFCLTVVFLLVQNTQFSTVAVGRYSATSVTQVSLATRLEYWATILPPFLQTMGRGLGIGGSMWHLAPVPHPHNIYLSILCDMGFVGILLFSILMLIIVKEILSVLKFQKTFLQYMLLTSCGAVIAIMIHGLVDFHYNTTEFWMFAGFGMAALRLAKQEIADQKQSIIGTEE